MAEAQAQVTSYLTPEEVAKRLGLARTAVDELIANGQLPSTRHSQRRVRIPVAELERYIAARTIVPPDPDELPDAAARRAATAAALKRRAAAEWDGVPQRSAPAGLTGSMKIEAGNVLKW